MIRYFDQITLSWIFQPFPPPQLLNNENKEIVVWSQQQSTTHYDTESIQNNDYYLGDKEIRFSEFDVLTISWIVIGCFNWLTNSWFNNVDLALFIFNINSSSSFKWFKY